MLDRAVATARTVGDSTVEATALIVLARMRSRTAGFDSAGRLIARAESIVPSSDAALAAEVRCTRAGFLRTTKPAAADSLIDAALALAESSGNPRATGRCLQNRATLREFVGHPRLAQDAIVRAIDLFTAAHDLDGLAASHQFAAYIGVQYAANFAYSRLHADSAIAAGRIVGNPLPVAWAQLNLGQLALRLGDPRAADRATTVATSLFKVLDDRTGIATAGIVRGDAAYLTGRLGDARLIYTQADSLFRVLGFNTLRSSTLMRLSGIARETGAIADAERLFDEAMGFARAARMVGVTETDVFYLRGLMALAKGDYTAALRDIETFRERIGTRAVHFQYDAQARIAEAYAGLGKLDEAARVLADADRNAEALRRLNSEREAQVATLDSRRFDFDTDLGLATIVSRFAAANRASDALRIAEARRARYLWTQMLRRHALGGDTVARQEVRVARVAPSDAGLERLTTALPESTALLEYVTGRGNEPTTLLVVSRRGVTSVALPAADSLVGPIASFVAALEGGTAAPAPARRLGAALLAPALAALGTGITRLVIVPDGPLYRLPFDALEVGGEPLLAKYVVSLAPSARIAASWWTTPATRAGGRVLALGDPAFARDAKLVRLTGSGSEARAVTRGLPNARLLLDRDATKVALMQGDLRDVRVLHLATHAEVEDFGILRSAIALTPSSGDDGRLRAEDIASLDLDADLVVLSGCRTAGGVVVTGEGIQGLIAPFLEAGARSVVATQWAIGDRSTVALMTAFYREMRAGRSAADALRAAKLASRRAGDPPSIWASLVLTGDPAVRPLVGMTTAGR